jgi:hypothetical protein
VVEKAISEHYGVRAMGVRADVSSADYCVGSSYYVDGGWLKVVNLEGNHEQLI